MTGSTRQEQSTVLIEDEIVDGGVIRLVSLNRPSKRNALDTRLLIELHQAYAAAEVDERVRAIVLQSSGPAFCAGGDTFEFPPDQKDEVIRRAEIMADVLRYPSALSVPVIAAVHGPALGAGAALALSADLVVAGTNFSLGYPELPNGAYPPLVMPSALSHLSRTVAFELVTTGRRLDAASALAHGVINSISDDPSAEALTLATRYTSLDSASLAATKKLFYRQAELAENAALREGLKDFIARQ